jgi:hypothetical protein
MSTTPIRGAFNNELNILKKLKTRNTHTTTEVGAHKVTDAEIDWKPLILVLVHGP